MKSDFTLAKEELGRIDIRKLAADFYMEPRRNDSTFFVKSPATHDKTASLALFPNSNRFTDFSNANYSGDIIGFVAYAERLDALFSAYVRLCTRYWKLPTLECFSFLTGINRATYRDWRKRTHRSSSMHGPTVEKWFNICKGFVVDELSNSSFANPNLIFTAKSAYGLRETSPAPVEETEWKEALPASMLPKLGDGTADSERGR